MPASGDGKVTADWKSNKGGGGGGKSSRYQRQQAKGSKGGGKKSYAEGSQSARLSAGGRKESNVKAHLREQGDALDKRFGYVLCLLFIAGGVERCGVFGTELERV